MQIVILLVCWVLWYLAYSSRTLIAPLLPIFEGEFLISHTLAGSLYLSLSLGSTVSYLIFAGWLSHRVGYKRAIIISFIFMIIFFFFMKFAITYNAVATICFFIGLGSGIYMPCAIPILTTAFEPKNWGKAISFHDTAVAASILTIPLLVVFLLNYLQWRSIFVFICGIMLVATVIFWFLAPDSRPREKKGLPLAGLLRRKDFWILITLTLTAMIVANGVYSITPLFLVNERAFELAMANKVFGYTRIGGFVVTLVVGFLLDRIGAKRIMFTTLLIAGLSTIGLAVGKGFWVTVTMLLIQATVCVPFFPCILFAISKITTLEERALFTSLCMGAGMLFGVGLAPLFMGFVADIWSFQVGIFIIGAFTMLMCFLFKGLKNF